MAKGPARLLWNLGSQVLAQQANIHRSRGRGPVRAAAFHPFPDAPAARPQGVPIKADNIHLLVEAFCG